MQSRSDLLWVFGNVNELTFTFAICCRPSVCRLPVCLSVTFVHHTQPVEIFGNVFTPFGTLAIHWHPRKFLRRSFQGNPTVERGKVNARGVAKYRDFGPIEGYISETVQERRYVSNNLIKSLRNSIGTKIGDLKMALNGVMVLSVTFVQHTKPVEIFGNFSTLFGTLAIHWHPRKFLRRST